MRKSLLYLLIVFIVLDVLGACSKKNEPENPTTVQISVVDGKPGLTGNATVSLYTNMTAVNNNTPKYTLTTDANNQVNITVDYSSQYFVIVTKGTAKNYYSGFTPIGIFQSQAEISSSPVQSPAATVGSVKYQDTNGDGIINNADKTDAPVIAIKQNMNNSKTVTVY